MKVSKEAKRSARRIFRACLEKGRLDENRVRGAVATIAKLKPRGYLNILSEFARILQYEVKKHALHVESAIPLDGSRLDEIKSRIQTRFSQPLNLTYITNPSLIGGLRIKIGSNVWDGSVAARLQQLQNF